MFTVFTYFFCSVYSVCSMNSRCDDSQPVRLVFPSMRVSFGRFVFGCMVVGCVTFGGLTGTFAPMVTAAEAEATTGQWQQLFNGKNLDGWTPKIRYHEAGDNFKNTFRVEDGILKVRYDGYEEFNETFGHLFYKDSFSHYRFRVEYRFVDQQCKGGPGWALRNSGVMIHGERPETMAKDQDFPVSIEVQLLGGDGKKERTTSNLCTPGTNVVMDGKLFLPHCTSSTSETYHGDQWVTAEIEVRGNQVIKHILDGKTVLQYEQSQLDDRESHSKELAEKAGTKMLSGGSISLQSESHPVDFRKVEIMVLEP